ncbi:hypothetical protein ACKC9G_12505 [Pokkaliibacter sp. CJK22405]|uniref:hypothetical protein n=1 Tax=Pokkaliibacter sp. CJK22405 TaxID=3384615 RepID=UPI0039850177
MATYQELELEAQTACDQVRNSPQGRRKLRVDFYQRFGNPGHGLLNYGDSEIAFLDWEIRRGVLNPIPATLGQQAGSHWWRDVNLRFIYFSELAGLMYAEEVQYPAAPAPVQAWLHFLHCPSSESWYRAHNTSILAGFEEYRELAFEENAIEQKFLNIILYRLMFAQALVNGATVFGDLGKLVANPQGLAVDLLVHIEDFYPCHYPLTLSDLPKIEGIGLTVEALEVRVMDSIIILPHLTQLYTAAAGWNAAPWLLQYQKHGKPVYPHLNSIPSPGQKVPEPA